MGEKNTHVTGRKDGQWTVKGAGDKRLNLHDTQHEAIEAGKPLAQKNKSDRVIHNRKNRIRDRDSYGKNPFPPGDKKHQVARSENMPDAPLLAAFFERRQADELAELGTGTFTKVRHEDPDADFAQAPVEAAARGTHTVTRAREDPEEPDIHDVGSYGTRTVTEIRHEDADTDASGISPTGMWECHVL